jgi:hypothetical protein
LYDKRNVDWVYKQVGSNRMITKAKIKELEDLFTQKMYECETESGDTLMCSINEAFEGLHENGHNCLGCNLQDHVDLIKSFLETGANYKYREHFFVVYSMLLYLLSERVLEIMKIIGLPESYREAEFKILKEIKLWANFHKHPKAFILTHHPEYFFEEEFDQKHHSGKKIIDGKFIKKYYSGEDKNKYRNLVSELKNNDQVVVVLPGLVRITAELCTAFEIFITTIKENPAYSEILNDLTTLEDYFDLEDIE